MLEPILQNDQTAFSAQLQLYHTKSLGLLLSWSHTLTQQAIEDMEMGGIQLGNGYYILGVHHLIDAAGNRHSSMSIRREAAVRFMQDLFVGQFLSYIGYCSGDLVVLFCFPRAAGDQDVGFREVDGACLAFVKRFQEAFPDQQSTMLLSLPFHGYQHISRRYASISERLEYLLFMGELPLLYREPTIQSSNRKNPQYMDSDAMRAAAIRMATAISRRQHREIKEAEIESLEQLFAGQLPSLKPVHFRLYTYLCALLQQLEHRGIVDRQFTLRHDFFENLTNASSYQAFCIRFQSLIRTVLDNYDRAVPRPLSGAARLQQIRSYCQEHYADLDLTVSSLAELFGISQPQLSASFKKQYGESLLGFINSLRIEKVKQLLTTTKKPQAEIAAMCGFNNITTMQRLFSKLEQCTPGQYRARA